jgi:hypothetical protein
MVLGQQHPQALKADTVAGSGAFLGDGHFRAGQRQDDGELGPFARRGRGVDLAAHHAGQGRADGQAETGPAEPARDRIVGLLEPAEQPLANLGVEPDARVANGELEGLVLALDGQGHLAPVGELDGVAEQIAEDLRDPAAVAQPGALGLIGDAPCQAQTLGLR